MFNFRHSLLSSIGLSDSGLTVSALTGVVMLAAATPALAQELSCGGISVRLFCDRRDERSVFCLASHAEIILGDGQTRAINTPRYLRSDMIPAAAGCAHGDGGNFLVITFTNGGNCNDCEKWALFRTDGTEATKGGGDFDAEIRKMRISMPEESQTIYIK